MTTRLVGLMTVVLILCLASFALLMHHNQQQVMGEVAEIATQISRRTVESFGDVGWFGPPPFGQARHSERARASADGDTDDDDSTSDGDSARGFLLFPKGDGPTQTSLSAMTRAQRRHPMRSSSRTWR